MSQRPKQPEFIQVSLPLTMPMSTAIPPWTDASPLQGYPQAVCPCLGKQRDK